MAWATRFRSSRNRLPGRSVSRGTTGTSSALASSSSFSQASSFSSIFGMSAAGRTFQGQHGVRLGVLRRQQVPQPVQARLLELRPGLAPQVPEHSIRGDVLQVPGDRAADLAAGELGQCGRHDGREGRGLVRSGSIGPRTSVRPSGPKTSLSSRTPSSTAPPRPSCGAAVWGSAEKTGSPGPCIARGTAAGMTADSRPRSPRRSAPGSRGSSGRSAMPSITSRRPDWPG